MTVDEEIAIRVGADEDEDIVAQLHRVREELAAKEGDDMKRILAAVLRRQAESGRTVVEYPPRPARDVRVRTA